MPGPFGDHQLKIPYEPVAELLAKYASEVRTVTLDTDAIFADVN